MARSPTVISTAECSLDAVTDVLNAASIQFTMMKGKAAEAGFMSAMVAVLVVCLGSMFLIQAIPSVTTQYDNADVEVFWELLSEASDGVRYPDEARLLIVLDTLVAREGVNAASLEIRPSLPFGERMTIMTGMAEGLRDSSVKTVLFTDERGERIPYFVTVAVWKDA